MYFGEQNSQNHAGFPVNVFKEHEVRTHTEAAKTQGTKESYS